MYKSTFRSYEKKQTLTLRQRFIRELEYRNNSPRTVRNYTSALIQISKYYNCSPDLLDEEQIKSYLHYCKETLGLSFSSLNQTISALKLLHRDVLGTGWDIDTGVKRPKRGHYMPVILSRKEIGAMLRITANPKHRLIIALLYSTGIRIEELLELKWSDLDYDRRLIRIVKGKGQKPRDVLLSEKLLPYLQRYREGFWPQPEVYVLESRESGKPYSRSSTRKVVKRAAERAGVTKNVSPHTLRHTCATHMLEDGVHLKAIQKLLGHTSLRSTMLYLHLAEVDASITSPLDRLES
jgi:site-specific recombinase XerD